MAYCNEDQVKGKNHLLLDSLASEIINPYIAKAQVIVDGMLKNKYSVPFTTPDALIQDITAKLAAADLINDTVGNTGTDEDPTQGNNLRKEAMELLKLINDGSLELIITQDPDLNQARCITYNHQPAFQKLNPITKHLQHWDPSNPASYHRSGDL